jgi:hypothetical protein
VVVFLGGDDSDDSWWSSSEATHESVGTAPVELSPSAKRRDDLVFWGVINMYNYLVIKLGTPVSRCTWKAKIPLKIKIFLWYLKTGIVLTKDNLVKRQWKGCTKCYFCTKQETIEHLFFDCPMTRLMWGLFVLHLGLQNRWMWGIFVVLGLEVFRTSKRTLY